MVYADSVSGKPVCIGVLMYNYICKCRMVNIY